MSAGISRRTGEGREAAPCSLGGFLWWPQGSRSLLALLCPSLTLCPGQMSQDEAVALTPWKEEGPFSWQRDPPSHTLDLHIQVADVCGWSDVICSWSGRTVMAWPLRLCAGHFWGLSWVWGALLGVGGSLPLRFSGAGGSSGHGELSWTCVRLSWAQGSLLAWGAFLATPGGLSWPPWRGQLVPTALTPGRDGLSSPCVIQLWGRGGEEQIFPSWDCPRVTHSTSQTRKCSGLSSLGGRGSAPALLSSFAVTKLNLTSDLQTLQTHPSAPSLQRDTQEGLSCGGGWTLRAQSTRGLSSGSAVALGKSLHLFASVSSSVK